MCKSDYGLVLLPRKSNRNKSRFKALSLVIAVVAPNPETQMNLYIPEQFPI